MIIPLIIPYFFSNIRHFQNKKLISISPGGIKGFYLLGILTYIKEKYNISNYIFSGASAGSWCSLIMCMKDKFDLLNFMDDTIVNSDSLYDIQYNIKNKLLNQYDDSDFDLNRIHIGVTSINNFKLDTTIYSNFNNLENAIDCCIASSHIPFLSGKLFNKYNDKYSFDGGFSSYPYIKDIKPIIHIHPNIWNGKHNCKIDSTLFNIKKYNYTQLFLDGYNDAIINKKFLDTLFYI